MSVWRACHSPTISTSPTTSSTPSRFPSISLRSTLSAGSVAWVGALLDLAFLSLVLRAQLVLRLAVFLLSPGEAIREASGQPFDERRIEPRTGFVRCAQRVQRADARIGSLGDHLRQLRVKLRLNEDARHIVVVDDVADPVEASRAKRSGVRELHRAFGLDFEPVLEIDVAVVGGNERLAAYGRHDCFHSFR